MSENKDMVIKKLNITFTKKDIQYLLVIALSALIYAFGMESFVKSGNLFPGGFAGISRLISLSAARYIGIDIPFGVIYWLLNFTVVLFIWGRIGHKFVLYSILWFSLSSLFTIIINVPIVTNDMLLIAVFGGLLNGLAIGLALRSNASSGGTDFIAIDLSARLKRPTWNYMLGVNAIVLVIAGLLFGWDKALYSIIFQYVSTQVVNTMHQRYKVTRLQVTTDHADEVCEAVFKTCRHGITRFPVEGAYKHQPHTMLQITINNYQLNEVIEIIRKTDSHAFISLTAVERVIGNYYQKPLD